MTDQLKRLHKLRDNLTQRMETAKDYSAAGIAKNLVDVLARIEELEEPKREKPKSPLDEFQQRLAEKQGTKRVIPDDPDDLDYLELVR